MTLGRFNSDFVKFEKRATARIEEINKDGYFKGEIIGKKKDGTEFFALAITVLVKKDNKPIYMIDSFIDITEQKKTEKALRESEERFRSISSAAQDAIIIMDNNGEIAYWNEAAARILGYVDAEVLGKNLHRILSPEGTYEKFMKGYEKFKYSGQGLVIEKTIELFAKRKNGKEIPIELSVSSVKIEDKWSAIGIMRDISERKSAEEKIKASLKEKEVLLKEIHHRVKNNMQVISSLLSLQSSYAKNEEATGLINESRKRIETMALIHESLYQSSDMANIQIKDYITTLASQLVYTYEPRSKLTLDIDKIKFIIEKAIPCGLIINELITNALKYAFPDESGEIKISLHKKGYIYKLVISDNGIGLPEDIDFDDIKTMGLTLVNSLVQQLNGTLKVNRKDGTEYIIEFS